MRTKIAPQFSSAVFSNRAAVLGSFYAVAALAMLSFATQTGSAVGFRLPNQDPEAIARGNAFVATADNPSAIYYNPAGITQLEGQNLSAGLYFISSGVKFEGTDGGAAQTKKDFQTIPQFYYVVSPKDLPVSFGLGVYVPYGLGIDYGVNSSFKNVAQNGNLLYATINPVIAWKITDQLSIAAGPTINYSKVDLNQGIVGFANSQFHFVGDDYAIGFNAGVQYKPIEEISFGVNYHYSTEMDYKGHSSAAGLAPFNLSSSTTASINFPQYVVVGVSYRPTTNWNIEVDVDYTDWDNLNSATLKNTPFGDVTLPFNYRSSFMYELGATRQLPHHYFVSAGFIYSENSSPSANFDPLIPDSDLYLLSLGFGHHGEHFGWAISYTAAFNPGRFVGGSSFNNDTPGTASNVNGTYRVFNNAINLAVNYKF